MVNKLWSTKAFESLKTIFEFYEENPAYARKLVAQIVKQIDKLKYPEQYQEDEILGLPYRRIILKGYRVVYKVTDSEDIEILQIFSNSQSPQKINRDFNS